MPGLHAVAGLLIGAGRVSNSGVMQFGAVQCIGLV